MATPSEPFRLLDLPTEIRLKILYETNLVMPSDPTNVLEDMQIHWHNRSCRIRTSKDKEWSPKSFGAISDFPGALFRVSKQIRHESLLTFFSSNRISLCCDDRKSLKWLQLFPAEYLRQIRKLDIVREYSTLVFDSVNDYCHKGMIIIFDALIAFIKTRFDVPRLFLSLVIRTYSVIDSFGEQQAKRLIAMGDFAKVIWKHFEGSLEKFHVYLFPALGHRKHGSETLAMIGPESSRIYDGDLLGKIPAARRRNRLTHKMLPLLGACESHRDYSEDDGKGMVRWEPLRQVHRERLGIRSPRYDDVWRQLAKFGLNRPQVLREQSS